VQICALSNLSKSWTDMLECTNVLTQYCRPYANILQLVSRYSSRFLALGPMAHAIAAFLTVQSEIQSEMLGVLRGLGLRDSVFWASWWIPFLLTFVRPQTSAATARRDVHRLMYSVFSICSLLVEAKAGMTRMVPFQRVCILRETGFSCSLSSYLCSETK
jgi:hypothetical protein